MEENKQETIADIVAEVRARAKAWPDPSLVQYDERLADRIDAAHKREREAGAEAYTTFVSSHGRRRATKAR